MHFSKWLDTFVSEKGLDLEHRFRVEGPSGENSIPLACLLDAIKAAPANEQAAIKTGIVRLDFANAPILPFFKHLAGAIAL